MAGTKYAGRVTVAPKRQCLESLVPATHPHLGGGRGAIQLEEEYQQSPVSVCGIYRVLQYQIGISSIAFLLSYLVLFGRSQVSMSTVVEEDMEGVWQEKVSDWGCVYMFVGAVAV